MSFKNLQIYCDFLNNGGEELLQALSFLTLHNIALRFLQQLGSCYVPALIVFGV